MWIQKRIQYRTNLMSSNRKMEICLDKQCFAGALLVDLAFDTINHELIIAKLHAYGFSIDFYR